MERERIRKQDMSIDEIYYRYRSAVGDLQEIFIYTLIGGLIGMVLGIGFVSLNDILRGTWSFELLKGLDWGFISKFILLGAIIGFEAELIFVEGIGIIGVIVRMLLSIVVGYIHLPIKLVMTIFKIFYYKPSKENLEILKSRTVNHYV
jgi:hypothetical protein